MRPAIARPTTPPRGAIHDDRRVGGSPPGRTMRDVAHPSHPGRGGGDAPASRPGRPGRSGAGTIRPGPSPGEADGQPDPPPPRSRTTPSERPRRRSGPAPRGPGGNRWARSDPSKNPTMMAAGSSPAGPSRTRDGSAGRSSRTRMPPPTGARTGRGGRLLRGGCGGVPRSPGPPGEEGRRFLREPVPHAGLPELCLQTSDPGVPFRGHGISAEAGVPPPPSCDPAPDRLRHRTVRSGCLGHRPGPWTIPRTTCPSNPAPHPGADTTQPHLDHFTHRPKNTKHSKPPPRLRTRPPKPDPPQRQEPVRSR